MYYRNAKRKYIKKNIYKSKNIAALGLFYNMFIYIDILLTNVSNKCSINNKYNTLFSSTHRNLKITIGRI